ncbi:hypothetical protein EAE96_005912 [Botrytis aclada]|nr:hypothetical protein EAE96_005912 [Botrytis aclada]
MDGQDCEMAKDSPSRSPSLESDSEIEEDSTSRAETEDGSDITGLETENAETYGSNSYQDHSFGHVLDELPWSKTTAAIKVMCYVSEHD